MTVYSTFEFNIFFTMRGVANQDVKAVHPDTTLQKNDHVHG